MGWNGAKSEFPYTFSVGAVVFNDQGQILCHHFSKYAELEDFYILMRETLEPNETIEQALGRGLQEEFGATAEIEGLLGGLNSTFPDLKINKEVLKTTLYFRCRITGQDQVRSQQDEESGSRLVWMDPAELIAKMKDQTLRYPNRTDMDESEIVRRAISI